MTKSIFKVLVMVVSSDGFSNLAGFVENTNFFVIFLVFPCAKMVFRNTLRALKIPFASFLIGSTLGYIPAHFLCRNDSQRKGSCATIGTFVVYAYLTRKNPSLLSRTAPFAWNKLPLAVFAGIGCSSALTTFTEMYESIPPADFFIEMGREAETKADLSYYSDCSIITPIAEEVMFRGIIFQSLLKIMKVIPAGVLSSILFGILHEENQVSASLFGAYMIWIYNILGRHPGALAVTTAFHSFHNFQVQQLAKAFAPRFIENEEASKLRRKIFAEIPPDQSVFYHELDRATKDYELHLRERLEKEKALAHNAIAAF